MMSECAIDPQAQDVAATAAADVASSSPLYNVSISSPTATAATHVEVDDTAVTAVDHDEVVDAAFARLFGYAWGTRFALPPAVALPPEQRMLVRMVGPGPAARILAAATRTTLRRRQSRSRSSQHRLHGLLRYYFQNCSIPVGSPEAATNHLDNHTDMMPPPSQSPPISPKMLEKKNKNKNDAALVSNRLETTTTNGSNTANANTTTTTTTATIGSSTSLSKPSLSSLDQALNDLKRVASGNTGTPSTIAKTSADWDQFKQHTLRSSVAATIEEKAQSKDSYLHRQDFLQRVDHRTFAVEKCDRDRDRLQRDLKSSGTTNSGNSR